MRSTHTPTPVGQFPVGEVVVDRLIMVLDPPTRQSPMDCGVTGSATNQHRPSAEYLIHPSRFTGELEPMLATKWSMSEDARTWNFKLRKGVPWHFGFGEFTAADVENSLNYYINEGCKASYSDYFRNNPDADVEIINEYEVNFHMRVRPEVLFDHWVGFRGLPMTSKAQWDSGCPTGVADYQPGARRRGGLLCRWRVNGGSEAGPHRRLPVREFRERGWPGCTSGSPTTTTG